MTEYVGPCRIDCEQGCEVPSGRTLTLVPAPRHQWSDVLVCPHGCGRAFLIVPNGDDMEREVKA